MNNTLSIDQRKLRIIRFISNLNNIQVIDKLERLVNDNSENIAVYTLDNEALTTEQYNEHISNIKKQVENGDYQTIDELIEELENE